MGCSAFQISLDGDKESHDKLRILMNGDGTYDQIWKNLVEAHKTDLDFKIVIRLHVNANNQESMRRLIARISDTFESDARFSLFIRGLGKFAGKNDAILPIIDNVNLAKIIADMKSFATTLGLSLVDSSYIGDAQCYASKFNSFIVRANGRIGKCILVLYDERDTIGHITGEGKLILDSKKFTWWTRGNFTGDKVQLHCPLRAPDS